MSTTSKALFKMSSDLSDISGSSPAPDRPKPELSGVFADLFDNKIRQLRENIDSASDSPDADPLGHDSAFGAQSVPQFEPVSETEVREMIMKCPPKSSEACSYLTAQGNDRWDCSSPRKVFQGITEWWCSASCFQGSKPYHRYWRRVVLLCFLLSRKPTLDRYWRKRAFTLTCSKTTGWFRICRFSRKCSRKEC